MSRLDPAEELLVLLHANTTVIFIATISLKLIFFNLLGPLNEIRNCVLCIIRLRSLFCPVRVYVSLCFLPILLVKLGFRLSAFLFFVYLYLWLLILSFGLYFVLNVFLKDITLYN